MKRAYRLEFEVILDEADEQKAIQVARDHYRATGGAQEFGNNEAEELREIPAEDFIAEPIDAIIMLLRGYPLCDVAGIELECVTCDEPKLAASYVETNETVPEALGAQRLKCTARSAGRQAVPKNRQT